MSTFSLQLNPLQLKVLGGIQKSAFFKKQLIARTTLLEVDSLLRIDTSYYVVKRIIGSGLISVVYELEHTESGESFALKRSRAKSRFFSEALRIEKAVTELLVLENGALGVIPIVHSSPSLLLKSYCTFPTLQALLYNKKVTTEHIETLEKCLSFCNDLAQEHDLLLDLSPKNIVWNGSQWLLIDAGPKIHQSEFSEVIKGGKWENYLNYITTRVTSDKSEPSVLTTHKQDLADLSANSWVFIKEWWDWFPVDDSDNSSFFFTAPSQDLPVEEMIYKWDDRENQCALLSSIGQHPLIQRIAEKSWAALFKADPPENLIALRTQWLFDYQAEPIDWDEFVTEIRPIGIGKRLKELFPTQKALPLPRIEVTEYRHWRDIINQPDKHRVTDIFCHSPLPVPKVLNRPELDCKQISLSHIRSKTFCELEVFGSNSKGEAIVIIPGFRATKAAAYELIKCLEAKKPGGHYIVVEIGMFNQNEQKLVTAGRWELILLWEVIEYCTRSLEIDVIDIIAASHGAIGAWFVSCIHPSIRRIALDSPLLQPMKIIAEMAAKRNEPLEPVCDQLEQAGMPSSTYSVFKHPPSTIDVLTIRPEKDLFGELCGELQVGKCIYYKGGHAATLRHDSGLIGIPSLCIDAFASFLA